MVRPRPGRRRGGASAAEDGAARGAGRREHAAVERGRAGGRPSGEARPPGEPRPAPQSPRRRKPASTWRAWVGPSPPLRLGSQWLWQAEGRSLAGGWPCAWRVLTGALVLPSLPPPPGEEEGIEPRTGAGTCPGSSLADGICWHRNLGPGVLESWEEALGRVTGGVRGAGRAHHDTVF